METLKKEIEELEREELSPELRRLVGIVKRLIRGSAPPQRK